MSQHLPGAGVIKDHYDPLRTLADVEALEKIPLEQRITRWDFALNLLDGCRDDPNRIALYATHNGNVGGEVRTWTFGELERRATQCANLLRASGMGTDDVVAVVTPTVPGLFATMMGGLLAVRVFPINWMLDAHALADLMQRAQVKMVIALGKTEGFSVWENVQAAVASMPIQPKLFTLHEAFSQPAHDDLLVAASQHPGDRLTFARETAKRDSIACYVHSGGTTGHPKIVKILHGGMVFRHWAANNGLAFTRRDVVLSDTPLFHIGGLLVRGLVNTANGNTAVIPSIFGARDKTYIANYWRYIERFGITQVSGVPTTLSVLAKNPPTTENISSLRPYFATGSTAMAPAVQDRVAEVTGARVLQSYGMTENTSHCTLDPRDGEVRRRCSGIRVPYVKLRIVKMGEGATILRDCAIDEIGMVLVGGPGVAGGYLDSSQDRGAFLPDGFFVSGDLGSMDSDGYLRISGREKDLIIRGGHNIEPGLIEEALLQSPYVALAAAVGKPDAHAGELPIAYVELHPGMKISPDALLLFASERIPERPAIPKEIFIVDKLPLTSVGKPMKHVLQMDAAKRVFESELHILKCAWTIDMVNTGGSGLLTKVYLREATQADRQAAEKILSTFSLPYEINST
jgi:fatty-acyl-CoA synthase